VFFFSSRRRHTRFDCDWSSDVCSSDLAEDAFTRHLEQLLAPIELHPPDGRPLPLLEVAGEGVLRLVVVLVGVEQGPRNLLSKSRSEERRVGKVSRAPESPGCQTEYWVD